MTRMAHLLVVHHSPTRATRRLTEQVVAGAHDDQQLSEPFTTLTEMIERSNAVEPWQAVKYPTWYPAMAEETRAALIALLLDDLDVDGFLTRCQKAADRTAADDAIAKQTR